MNELSLFSGAGGGLLGARLLGWRTLGYVENNDYCQRVLKARIADGILDGAPIFGDIRTFILDGYAEAYQGLVDVVTAGFPCQPFSRAGKQAQGSDSRNMWPQTIECIRSIRPRFAFLENSPNLINLPYGRTVFRDLAESGYECRWCILSAADVGAPHLRKRLWILADSDSSADKARPGETTEKIRSQTIRGEKGRSGRFIRTGYDAQILAHPTDVNDRTSFKKKMQRQIQQSGKRDGPETRRSRGPWQGWDAEPDMDRVVDGLPFGLDRTSSLGNAQVPLVAATAWRLLNGY